MAFATDMPNILQNDCTQWRSSSQAAADFYEGGMKLWSKQDFIDIERQLANSKTQQIFQVRLISDKLLHIANPMFGVESPIWKPRIKFREYWRLVKEQPDDPAETYHCTYLPNWINTSARAFRGVVKDPGLLFKENGLLRTESGSCKLLAEQLQRTVSIKAVKKIICFGLGDICRKPPERMRRNADTDAQSLEASFVRDAMTQHSIALTLRDICNNTCSGGVELLAQDPDYTDEAKEILEKSGFSVVGDFGAGGFAEIDDESLIFSVFVEAPLKQIIADIARPPIIISTGFDVFNDSEKPWVDAESPRTVDLWKQYNEKTSFPISVEEEKLMSMLREVYIYTRRDL